jgi:hypothetical protein
MSTTLCYVCRKYGHKKSDCPEEKSRRKAKMKCHKCSEIGHSKDDCKKPSCFWCFKIHSPECKRPTHITNIDEIKQFLIDNPRSITLAYNNGKKTNFSFNGNYKYCIYGEGRGFNINENRDIWKLYDNKESLSVNELVDYILRITNNSSVYKNPSGYVGTIFKIREIHAYPTLHWKYIENYLEQKGDISIHQRDRHKDSPEITYKLLVPCDYGIANLSYNEAIASREPIITTTIYDQMKYLYGKYVGKTIDEINTELTEIKRVEVKDVNSYTLLAVNHNIISIH